MLSKTTSNCNVIHSEYELYEKRSIKLFGFWIYLMSDCIIFATLFSTYSVLSNNVADGPIGKEIFKLPFILLETFFLLLSSLSYGAVILAMLQRKKGLVNTWLIVTFLLGLIFVCMELHEFHYLIAKGYGPDRSAFLSSFFALVGTHGLHVVSGLVWILVMIAQISIRNLTLVNQVRLECLGLFWHFLDIVWICVFTLVYLIKCI
ncbi:cytochrome o ubiquinol oxidase subunit III [Sodalis sp. CWE]|uniref:cytochrome o ubiquinol oxidase subunit III n=1 Tax=Sodalis sp. CWE TaxID=2803816 RepID=UPI001C7DF85F|nr:cytochrome o ubiquinol oxidase subunit III [Sodalis sp. CWE]MBX4181199.1 cytochrome o ubiquinol oxidase subunit III [Sodalis sp. CWE]